MQKLNLVEILKDCPKGTRLYSPLCGECELSWVEENKSYQAIGVKALCEYKFMLNLSFSNDGTYIGRYDDNGNYYGIGECMLFPSKDNRDWSTFNVNKPKFDSKTLKPFDRVIDGGRYTVWKCRHFSPLKYNLPNFTPNFTCVCGECNYEYCVPYNDDTKHLIDTTDEAPEFYQYWED